MYARIRARAHMRPHACTAHTRMYARRHAQDMFVVRFFSCNLFGITICRLGFFFTHVYTHVFSHVYTHVHANVHTHAHKHVSVHMAKHRIRHIYNSRGEAALIVQYHSATDTCV